MKLSLQMTMIFGAIFAIGCLAVAIQGFLALGDITDPTQAADAKGFAFFWTFLGGVAAVFMLLAWRLERTKKDDKDA